jgi:HlyD family secretion protein
VTSQAAPLAGVDPKTGKAAAGPRSRLARRLPVLVVVVGGLVAYGAYNFWLSRRPYEWSGTVEARTVSVGSRVGGRVKAVLVKEGDRVEAGQAIVELEPADLPAQRLMAKAQLDEAAATLDKLKNGARPEEIEQAKARAQTAAAALEETRTGARSEEIAGANARLVATQVAADKAKTDVERARRLFATQSISQAELDDAETALKGATAQRDAAAQALDELKNGSRREDIAQAQARALEARASAKLVTLGTRVEDIQAAQASVEAAQGRLEQMDILLGELTIRAPRASHVESLDLRPGDILAPNATAGSLVEDDQLYVRVYVPETQLGLAHPGQEVPISVDSFPDRTFQGTVEHINQVGEYSPRNLQTADERANQVFATRVGIKADPDLRAGMAAFVRVAR